MIGLRAAIVIGCMAVACACARPSHRATRVVEPLDAAQRARLDSLVEAAESYDARESRITAAGYRDVRLANGAIFQSLEWEPLPYLRNGISALLLCRGAADCRLWAVGEGTFVGVLLREPDSASAQHARWMTLHETRGRGTLLVMMSGRAYAVPSDAAVTRNWRRRNTIVVVDGRRASCLECDGPVRTVTVTPVP